MIMIFKAFNKRCPKQFLAYNFCTKEDILGPKKSGKFKGIKKEAYEYIEERLKKKSAYVIDKEKYKIDCGLLISRLPIFLHHTDQDMNWIKFRLKYYRKYNLFGSLPKDLMEFKINDPNDSINGLTQDNMETHEQKLGEGEYIHYHAHSKHFIRSDPNIMDKKSIQYAGANRVYLLYKEKATGKWVFPTTYVEDQITFQEMKLRLFKNISNNQFNVHFPGKFPCLVVKRQLNEEEKNDSNLRNCQGVKTYYFNAEHFDGKVQLPEPIYDDFAWVPRLEFNQFVDRDTYQNFVHVLRLF